VGNSSLAGKPTKVMQLVRKAIVSLAVVALVATLGACSKSSDKEKDASASASTSATVTESANPDAMSPKHLPAIPEVENQTGDIAAFKMGPCAIDGKKAKLAGKITSSASETVDYVVSVSFTTATSDVMGRDVVILRAMKPGETRNVVLKGKRLKGAVQCVPGVVYGTVKGN
jgi:hypothetical protein